MTTAGKYNRVGKKKGPLQISGALKKIDEDSSFVYVPMFRVAGPKNEVVEWLDEQHPNDKVTAIKTSYCKQNLKNKNILSAFNKEVKEAEALKKEISQSRTEMRTVNLMVLSELVKIYDRTKKTLYEKEIETFKDKLEMLKNDNKCLDVTNLTKKGSEGKKVMLTDSSSKKRLSQNRDELFYNMVYNPDSTSRFEGVKNALALFGGFNDKQIRDIVKQLQNPDNIININTQRSPVRSPVRSPSHRPVVDSPPRNTMNDSDSDDFEDSDED